MIYELPKTLTICEREYEIRSDYRAALDICAAFSDPELDAQAKAIVALNIMFPEFEQIPPAHYADALQECLWFINCGEAENENNSKIKLMDWEQDFRYIVPPVNRVLNTEIRELPYLHWWTFIGAYNEIGDCTFAQIVRIRDKRQRGEKLDKHEQKWYKQNREKVDFKTTYSTAEEELLKKWGT